MCGIVGFFGFRDDHLIQKMCEKIKHRGPDHTGIYTSDMVSLGNTRLSIIDVEGGNQPLWNEDRTICCVYNGEIYNFPTLKRELELKGHYFHTKTDTEVILHLYEEFGLEFPARLNGMFAFALWDVQKKQLLLGRDPVGIKPLHYLFKDKKLIFGSEIKSILCWPHYKPSTEYQSLHYLLNLRYIPKDKTLFKNIYRVLPGQMLLMNHQGIKKYSFANYCYSPDRSLTLSRVVKDLPGLLASAVRRQLISDVPIGVYLSGGMDSSTIVAMMKKTGADPINTYTLGFDEPTDELADARIMAKFFQTVHHEEVIACDALKNMRKVIYHTEEPKENALQGLLVSRFASQNLKVVLGGLGGDEIFGGYQINRYLQAGRFIHSLFPFYRLGLGSVRNSFYELDAKMGTLCTNDYRKGMQLGFSGGDPVGFYLILRNVWDMDRGFWSQIYTQDFLNSNKINPCRSIFEPYFQRKELNFLEAALDAEFHTKMPDDFLLNEDRTSMANSLEVRVPYLDHELVKYALTIPSQLKVNNMKLKYCFREAMKGLLPEKIIKKKKWGFTFNPYFQFKKDLKKTSEEVLTEKRIREQGIFNYAFIRKILDHPPHPRLRWHYFYLWILVGYQIWEDIFLTQFV